MLNRWEGIGNLGKDPELRYTTGQNPTAVCRYSIAVDKGYGEHKKTVWVNIVTLGNRAESDSRYLSKGKKIYASGELDIREFERQDGSRDHITEVTADKVEYLSGKEQDQNGWPPQTGFTQQPPQPPQYQAPQPQPYQAPQQQQFQQPQVQRPQPEPQGQYITKEQYEAEKQQQFNVPNGTPQGYTALNDDDIPF